MGQIGMKEVDLKSMLTSVCKRLDNRSAIIGLCDS